MAAEKGDAQTNGLPWLLMAFEEPGPATQPAEEDTNSLAQRYEQVATASLPMNRDLSQSQNLKGVSSMLIIDWLRILMDGFASKQPRCRATRQRRRPSFRPAIETLEQREVPSAAHALALPLPLAAPPGSVPAVVAAPHGQADARAQVTTDDGCKSYDGNFTSSVVPNPPPGAVLATHGILTGDLNATYDFVMTSLRPDPNDPTTFYYAGHSVITLTKNGHQLFTNDTGVMHIQPDGTALFTTTANIVGGTKNFKSVSGQFVASGVLNLATGQTVGTYTATICKSDR
jgi:hypothetical protein